MKFIAKYPAFGLTLVALLAGPPSRLFANDAQQLLSYEADSAASDQPLPGQELFEREWTKKDRLSRNGDGLGPMFNARSCVACHHQQGTGGGGGIIHNVDLLTLVKFTPGNGNGNGSARLALERMHPGFKTANSVTLHSDSNEGKVSYNDYRDTMLTSRKIQGVQREPARDALQCGSFVLERSQRQTPSLFGAGSIDKISDKYFADAAIKIQKKFQEEMAELQSQESSPSKAAQREVKLKLESLRRSQQLLKVSRFGWKGQTATLKDFVAGACANELGLQTKGVRQPAAVTLPSYRNEHVDMTAQQLTQLVEYVASLPPPKRWTPTSGREADGMARGAILFGQAKCQTCHTQDVEHVRGIYSDLRLHDMGYRLSDPSGPAMTNSRPRGDTRRRVNPNDFENPDMVNTPALEQQYYGAPMEDLASAWRTPPLWGVRDSAPYMHDGRASTLDEAIRLHDGEAAESAAVYHRMTTEQRKDLLAFVYSLGAP